MWSINYISIITNFGSHTKNFFHAYHTDHLHASVISDFVSGNDWSFLNRESNVNSITVSHDRSIEAHIDRLMYVPFYLRSHS